MSDKPPLPPGILPNIFDTDPPPLNPATIIGDGFVAIDQGIVDAEIIAAEEGETLEEELAEENQP